MGMFAIPTQDFLKEYRNSGRGIRQYALDLPPKTKQRLWELLDEKSAQGADLPYDYIRRGCAQGVLNVILDALGNVDLSHVVWPEKYQRPRREIIAAAISDYPWTRFAIHAIVGTEGDKATSNLEKVVIPVDLLLFLRQARLGDRPIIVGEGVELLPAVAKGDGGASRLLTPVMVACLLLAVSLMNFFCWFHYLDWIFLSLLSLVGAFMTYMLVFSSLPATSWNWLILPFNLLPLICWKWRAKWALPYACVLLAWSMFMLVTPHAYTDPAYALLACSFVFLFLKFRRTYRS